MRAGNIFLIAASASLLAACATTAHYDSVSSTGSTAIPPANDPEFRQVCAAYAGIRREFVPDKTKGLRTYDSVCGSHCAEALAEGYDFVDVIWLDYVWQNSALNTQAKRIERYRKAEMFDENCIDEPISAARYKRCFMSEKVKVPLGQTEAIHVSPVRSEAFVNEARVVFVAERRLGGRIAGQFDGYRDLSSGALSGYGKFSLEGPANADGVRARITGCPDRGLGPVASCDHIQSCRLPQPAP